MNPYSVILASKPPSNLPAIPECSTEQADGHAIKSTLDAWPWAWSSEHREEKRVPAFKGARNTSSYTSGGRPLKERTRLARIGEDSLAGRSNPWEIKEEWKQWGSSAVLQPYLGGDWDSTSSSCVEPLQELCVLCWVGHRARDVSEPSALIDSACATNATDSPVKADLIEACPHLRLFPLSICLLIVIPNRGGPPTKTFNFRQRECLNNSRHCSASTPVWNPRLQDWLF